MKRVLTIILLAAVPAHAALKLEKVAGGLERPVGLEAAPGDNSRLYVLEQEGRVRVVKEGALQAGPFLDLAHLTAMSHSERGLLGLAFHPQFSRNRRFFVHYTDKQGDTVLSEWRALSPDRADSRSERVLLRQKQPYANHNGGQVGFGPDGKLYLGLGDGGSAGDPQGNAQNLGTWLGKILRLEVDVVPRGKAYGVPKDNPFMKKPGAKPEIWAWGLRNPWRFSFDGGRLFIADVGQNRWEEIDVEELKEGGGKNYGWNGYEGLHRYGVASALPDEAAMPAAEYFHDGGRCSVTGGFVYRGKALPQLAGEYFYGDFCSGEVWSFKYEPGKAARPRSWTEELRPEEGSLMIPAFGRDAQGELYILNYQPGAVYRVVPASK